LRAHTPRTKPAQRPAERSRHGARPTRLGAAVRGVETARSSGTVADVDSLHHRYALLDAWRNRPHPPAPPDPAQAETQAARTRAADRRLDQLAAECEEKALRGSADFYRAQATLDWELRNAKDLAGRLDLPADSVPDNVYRLLDPGEVRTIRARWLDVHRTLLRRQVTAAPGSYARALDTAKSRLAALDDALAFGPVDLGARFDTVSEATFAEVAPWVAEQEGARESAITHREGQLLQETLARDGGDVPALLRLSELAAFDPTIDVLRVNARAMVLERLSLMTEPGRSSAVVDLLHDRIHDPLRAAWREAQLMERAAQEVPRQSFPRWMADQLTEEDLPEAALWIERTRNVLTRTNITVAPWLQRRDVDVQAFDRESAAILRRFSTRGAPAPAKSVPKPIDARPGASIDPPTDLTSLSYNTRYYYYDALRRLATRTELTPDAQGRTDQLALTGYADEVSDLERDFARLHNAAARPRADDLGFEFPPDTVSLTEGLFERAVRLRQGLGELHASAPDRVSALLDRIETVGKKVDLRSPEQQFLEASPVTHATTDADWAAWGKPRIGLPAKPGLPPPAPVPLDRPPASDPPARPFMDPAIRSERAAFDKAVGEIEPPPKPIERPLPRIPVSEPRVPPAEEYGWEWILEHARE
jgi:hypothetical protein